MADVIFIDDTSPPVVIEVAVPEVVETQTSTHEVVEVETPITVVVVESVTQEVVEVSEDHVVVVEEETHVVITEGIQGPPGRDGLDGVSGALPREHHQAMQTGVLGYVLPELPRAGTPVVANINGVKVAASVSGVNLTITEYTAGTIDATDELSVYYYV